MTRTRDEESSNTVKIARTMVTNLTGEVIGWFCSVACFTDEVFARVDVEMESLEDMKREVD